VWNPKVHYPFRKTPLLLLSQVNPVQGFPSSFLRILVYCNITIIFTSGSFIPSGLHGKSLYEFIFSVTRATCPNHLTLLDLVILIIVLYSTIIQPSTEQIRNKQINIIVSFVYYVHLLHVSIQLDHHQANIHKMYTHIQLCYYCGFILTVVNIIFITILISLQI
jgi:hypothetical protein